MLHLYCFSNAAETCLLNYFSLAMHVFIDVSYSQNAIF